MAENVGSHENVNIVRTENDTNDIVVTLVNPDGTPAVVTGWTAVLSIGSDNNTPLIPPKTYNGTGVVGGKIPINMNTFDVPIGTYSYDVRVTDTVTGDSPARVYFKGKFKVTERIN